MTISRAPGPASGGRAGPTGRALARNSLLNLIGLATPLAVGLLAMPAVVAGLREDPFGVLGLVWTAFGYLALLDLGLGRATTKFAAEAIAVGDDDELAALTRTAAVAQLAVGVFVAVVGVLAAAPLVEWVNVPAGLRHDATLGFVLIALAAPAMGLGNTFRGLLEAGQRFGIVNAIRTPASAATFLIPLLGVWLDWSLLTIVAVMVGARVAFFAAYAMAAVRVWPRITRSAAVERTRFARMIGFGGWVSVSSVVSPLLVYIDRFAIGALLSVAAVGYYTAPHEMVTRLSILPGAIVTTLFPAFAAMAVAGESGRTDVLFARSVKYVLALTAPPLLVLAAFSRPLLNAWLGPEFALHAAPALTFLSLGMIVNGAAHVPYTLIQARGRADLTAKLHLLELPLHVALLWLLVTRWGITGAALAWGARVVVDALLLFALAARAGSLRPAALRSERLPAVALLLAGCGAALWAAAWLLQEGVLQVLAPTMILLVWGVAAWTRGLSGAERAELAAGLPTVARGR